MASGEEISAVKQTRLCVNSHLPPRDMVHVYTGNYSPPLTGPVVHLLYNVVNDYKGACSDPQPRPPTFSKILRFWYQKLSHI